MKRYAPTDYQSTGRPPGMTRMTWKQTKNSNKKRSTPKDVENRKNGIKSIAKAPKEPRKPTKEENRANKLAAVNTAADLFKVKHWMGAMCSELKHMNEGKKGRPYKYSDSVFYWIMMLMGYMDLTYSMAAGIALGMLDENGYDAPSVSTVHRRIAKLAERIFLEAPPEDSRILCRYRSTNKTHRMRNVAVDSSGFSITEFFGWCEERWGVENRRVWLKLHALVDIDTGEILAYVLTYNDVGDPRMLPLLMELATRSGHKIKQLYADGAYGSHDNWEIMSKEYHCRFITSFRVNTVPKNRGCVARGDAAREWCILPYDEWVERSGYGRRWKVEVVFSDIKRLISECFRSHSENGHKTVSVMRVLAYNNHKQNRAQIMGVTGNGIAVSG